jgi:8-oxo-dGTP pyrophosphatase MutT (NUDIX family)
MLEPSNEMDVRQRITKPITSYGIILFTMVAGIPYFLIYKRRDSYGYMDFLRGKWDTYTHAERLFSLMSEEEKSRLLEYDFDELWEDLWVNKINNNIYTHVRSSARTKFISIKSSISHLIKSTSCMRPESMWGFPKGKKNIDEDDLMCAKREFHEETTIDVSCIDVCPASPYKEYYRGNNNQSYATFYYLAFTPKIIVPEYRTTMNCIRTLTISEEAEEIRWVLYKDAIEVLSPSRRAILKKVMVYLAKKMHEEELPPQSPEDVPQET